MNSKSRVGIGSIAVFAALLIGGGLAMAGSDAPQPANVNPTKAPITTVQPIPEPFQSLEDQLAAAKAHVIATANDSGVIVCLTTVGTLAGDIMVDRPVGAKPFTNQEKQLACEQGFKGSHA